MKKLFLLLGALMLVGAGCSSNPSYKIITMSDTTTPQMSVQPTSTAATATITTTTLYDATNTSSSTLAQFENEYQLETKNRQQLGLKAGHYFFFNQDNGDLELMQRLDQGIYKVVVSNVSTTDQESLDTNSLGGPQSPSPFTILEPEATSTLYFIYNYSPGLELYSIAKGATTVQRQQDFSGEISPSEDFIANIVPGELVCDGEKSCETDQISIFSLANASTTNVGLLPDGQTYTTALNPASPMGGINPVGNFTWVTTSTIKASVYHISEPLSFCYPQGVTTNCTRTKPVQTLIVNAQ